jgi:hypothetical protein
MIVLNVFLLVAVLAATVANKPAGATSVAAATSAA